MSTNMRLIVVSMFLASLVGVRARPENYKHDNGVLGKHSEVWPREKFKETPRQEKVKKKIPPSCDSQIYCQGALLHTVQMAALFNDSKHFVDMVMLDDESSILQKFDAFMKENNQQPTKDKIKKFVQENFVDSKELEEWIPEDFTPDPPFLSEICPAEIRTFAKEVVEIWPTLGRKISNDTLKNIHRHSLLPLPKGFIIPGGRFKETYYWDSYWIIKGLLISNMPRTAQGMLDNFVTLVKQYGFIPNGARVYYTQRSQPPVFAATVHEYYKATGDKIWLKQNIQYVDEEVMFWFTNRMVTITLKENEYSLARYLPESLGPRPESYKEDYKTASMKITEEDRVKVYSNLKGGAESGWDFSSRWFYDASGGNNGNLTTIDTSRTIPVDLNSFLYLSCHSLSMMYSSLGKLNDAKKWLDRAIDFRDAIRNVLFDEEDGSWYDFDIQLKRHRRDFFVSNLTPLWVGAAHSTFDAEKLIRKLHNDKVFEYDGGTPTTLKRTGEQWDLPNAWPPLQAIFVQALANTDVPEGKAIAEKLAKQWVTANIIGYEQTGYLFEKYDAIEQGQYGGGGEYEVQSGFGWTNGIALEFIRDYYSDCQA